MSCVNEFHISIFVLSSKMIETRRDVPPLKWRTIRFENLKGSGKYLNGTHGYVYSWNEDSVVHLFWLPASLSIYKEGVSAIANGRSESHYPIDYDAAVIDDGCKLREKLLWSLGWQ